MRPQGINIDPDKPCDAPMPMMMMLMLRGPASLIYIIICPQATLHLCITNVQHHGSTWDGIIKSAAAE
jgi:hypothetical protein